MSDVDILETNDPADDFFTEAARILEEDNVPPVNAPTLPHDGKTPTGTQREAELATAVDGGNRDMCTNSMPSQGLHVIFPQACSIIIPIITARHLQIYYQPAKDVNAPKKVMKLIFIY